MRFGSPIVAGFARWVTESVCVRDCDLPADSLLTINFWSINRDLTQWEKPYEFWPEHFYGVNEKGTPCVKIWIISCRSHSVHFQQFFWILKLERGISELSGNGQSVREWIYPHFKIFQVRVRVRSPRRCCRCSFACCITGSMCDPVLSGLRSRCERVREQRVSYVHCAPRSEGWQQKQSRRAGRLAKYWATIPVTLTNKPTHPRKFLSR